MPTPLFTPLFLVVFALFLCSQQGCRSTSEGRYAAASRSIAHQISEGVVEDLRFVAIDGVVTEAGVYTGMAGGAVVGGVAGARSTGTGTGAVVGMTAGVIAGAVIGPEIQKGMTSRKAQEMMIRLADGKLVAVVQEMGEREFEIGERVRVYAAVNGAVRVYHFDENPYVDADTGAYLPEGFDSDAAQ